MTTWRNAAASGEVPARLAQLRDPDLVDRLRGADDPPPPLASAEAVDPQPPSAEAVDPQPPSAEAVDPQPPSAEAPLPPAEAPKAPPSPLPPAKARQVITDALVSGPVKIGPLVHATGRGRKWVYRQLRAMAEQGLVELVGKEWTLL